MRFFIEHYWFNEAHYWFNEADFISDVICSYFSFPFFLHWCLKVGFPLISLALMITRVQSCSNATITTSALLMVVLWCSLLLWSQAALCFYNSFLKAWYNGRLGWQAARNSHLPLDFGKSGVEGGVPGKWSKIHRTAVWFFQVTGGTLFQNIHIRAVHTLQFCPILWKIFFICRH